MRELHVEPYKEGKSSSVAYSCSSIVSRMVNDKPVEVVGVPVDV